MDKGDDGDDAARRRAGNIRLALLLGGIALMLYVTFILRMA